MSTAPARPVRTADVLYRIWLRLRAVYVVLLAGLVSGRVEFLPASGAGLWLATAGLVTGLVWCLSPLLAYQSDRRALASGRYRALSPVLLVHVSVGRDGAPRLNLHLMPGPRLAAYVRPFRTGAERQFRLTLALADGLERLYGTTIPTLYPGTPEVAVVAEPVLAGLLGKRASALGFSDEPMRGGRWAVQWLAWAAGLVELAGVRGTLLGRFGWPGWPSCRRYSCNGADPAFRARAHAERAKLADLVRRRYDA